MQVFEELLKTHESHPLVYAEIALLHAMKGNDDLCRENYKKAIMCGYQNCDELSRRITAVYKFNQNELANEDDLPNEYYRRIEKEDKDA